ncbi:MAG: DNA polymerase III subunit gamma and tau [Mycobacteriales bacterium]
MAAALYNRYRPRTFAEVVGQEHVTAALTSALESGRTHHAYLFSGPRGCGKTSSARILAASLNCVHGPTPTPCGECEQCVAIRTGSSIDVVEIDAASHGGVDDARDLRERALYRPASGRYRVFVIDEAHQVSRDGFNALLKVVEEPPDYLVFVFATTEPDKVLPTIRSRTFSYQFRLVPPGALRDHLARLVEAEGAAIPPEVLPLVVRAGAGSVRDAMSVLDQLISGGVSTYEQAAALLGVTDAVLLDEATLAISARDGAALFGVVERVVGAGHDPRAFAKDLLERLRDLVLISAVPEAAERGLVEGVPPDQLDRMRQQASVLGAAELSRAADVVANGLVEMRGTTSPRLVLELVCARLLLPAASGDAGSIAARLDAVERRLSVAQTTGMSSTGAAPAPSAPTRSAHARSAAPVSPPQQVEPATADPTPPAPAQPVPPGAQPVSPSPATGATGSVDVGRLRESWPVVLDAVKKRQRVPYFMLHEHAQVATVEGDRVTLAFALAPIARQFENGTGPAVLAEALTEVVGGNWRVSVTLGEKPGGDGPTVAGFAPGDGPAEEPSPRHVDVTDPPDTEGPDPAADLPPSPPPREEPDPVALAREAFGATVISDTDNG